LIRQLETQLPQVAQVLKDPGSVNSLPVPEVPESIHIYDHWEKAANKLITNLWKADAQGYFHQ